MCQGFQPSMVGLVWKTWQPVAWHASGFQEQPEQLCTGGGLPRGTEFVANVARTHPVTMPLQ